MKSVPGCFPPADTVHQYFIFVCKTSVKVSVDVLTGLCLGTVH